MGNITVYKVICEYEVSFLYVCFRVEKLACALTLSLTLPLPYPFTKDNEYILCFL